MNLFRILPYVISSTGILLLIPGVIFFLKKKSEYAAWNTATGKLLGYSEEPSRSGRACFPIVEFQDASGLEVKFTSRTGSNRKPFAVGGNVPLRYPSKDPSKARIDRTLDLYFLEVLLLAAGAWSVIAGPLVAFLLRLKLR